MQKYEKFPEIYSLYKKVKRDKIKFKEIKKELSEYRWLLGKKKHEYPQIKPEMRMLLNKKRLELENEFEVEIAKAKFQSTDVNALYENFELNRDQLNSEYFLKIENRLNKAKDEINSINSAYKLRIKRLKLLNKEIKNNKKLIAEKWKALKLQRIANEVIYKDTYLQVKEEVDVAVYNYNQEFLEQEKLLIAEFKAKNPTIKNYKRILKKFRGHKLQPFKNENERLVYLLSIEINFLENQIKSKIDFQKKRIIAAKLELRYNQGKGDPVPFKFILEKCAMHVNKFSNWKFIAALRNGFFALMPLIIVGAIFIIFNNTFISPQYGGFLNLFSFTADTLATLEKIRGIGENIYNAGFAFYAFLLAGAIAYNLAPHYNANGWTMMVLAMGCYIIMNPVFITDIEVMGTSGLFTAVIISILSSIIYGNISKNERLKINLDKKNIPEGVIRSFNVMIPFAFTMILFSLFEFVISFIGYNYGEISLNGSMVAINSLNQLVVILFQLPLTEAISGVWGMTTVITFWQALWFIGVNPQGIISPIVEPLQLTGLLQNQAAAAIGVEPQYIFTNSFMFSFIQIGGPGGTIGLVIAILIFSKRVEWRSTIKFALIPMLFCVNEPLLFGIPIILNPILFIPFLIGPIIAGLIAYFSTLSGILGHTTVLIPQNILPIFGGFASTRDWMGIIICLINISVLTVIYAPFVLFANKAKKAEQVKHFKMNELPNILIQKGLEVKNAQAQKLKEATVGVVDEIH